MMCKPCSTEQHHRCPETVNGNGCCCGKKIIFNNWEDFVWWCQREDIPHGGGGIGKKVSE